MEIGENGLPIVVDRITRLPKPDYKTAGPHYKTLPPNIEHRDPTRSLVHNKGDQRLYFASLGCPIGHILIKFT